MWPVKYIYLHPSLSPSVIYSSSVFSRSLRYRIIRSMHGGDRASSFSIFLFQKLIEYLVSGCTFPCFCPEVVVLVLSESLEPSRLEHVGTKRCQCWSKFILINHQGITWSFHSRIDFHKNKQAELQRNFHTKSHMTAHRHVPSAVLPVVPNAHTGCAAAHHASVWLGFWRWYEPATLQAAEPKVGGGGTLVRKWGTSVWPVNIQNRQERNVRAAF